MTLKSILNVSVFVFFFLSFILFNDACTYNKEDELYGTICDTPNVKYSVEIKNILSFSCVGCHNRTVPRGGVNLDSYENVKEWADNGLLLESVIREDNPMPKDAPRLSSCNINQIRSWINNGALNN